MSDVASETISERNDDHVQPVVKDVPRDDHDLVASIEAVRASVRRQNGRESAIGPRAERTRKSLITAADRLFCERGFLAVSASDIAFEVGVAEPTFYQYFNGRSGVFMAVAGEHAIGMIESGIREWDPSDGVEGLRAFISNYVHLYLRDVAFYRVWEEATRADATIAELRREFFGSFKRRIASAIKRGKASGVLKSKSDNADLARSFTIGLVSYLFDAVVFDPPLPAPDEATMVDALTQFWSVALGVADS